MFWVDQVVSEVIAKNSKDHYVVTDWKTPSGRIHVGSLRGVLVHGVVTRGLIEHKRSVRWQWGFDDADPMDGLPIYLPASFNQYMGKPLALIPSPKPGYHSFGEYYAKEFQEIFESLGEKPTVVYSYALYKQGVFNKAIKIALDNAQKIRAIYLKVTNKKQPDDWLPIQMICENCGRIGTTRAHAWDGQEVTYQCEKNWVKYTEGCGYQGKASPFDGKAKLPWRVEWPAKWFTYKTDVEGAGKDHQTKGGSHDMAVAILEQVFAGKVPHNIPYEFFLVGGKKMSSSKGVGTSAYDVAQIVPAELLRMLMIMTRPNRAINFSAGGDTIPRLYDEYDRASQLYLEDPDSDLGRLFQYTSIGVKEPAHFHYRFSKVAYLLQMPHRDVYQMAKKEKGKPLTTDEREELVNRIDYAKKWLDRYAPHELKLTIQTNIPESAQNLTDAQKQFLQKLANLIGSKARWDGQTLHAKIHELKQSMNLRPTEAFNAIYTVILDKQSGPQAGWFLAALDRDFVIERFRNIS